MIFLGLNYLIIIKRCDDMAALRLNGKNQGYLFEEIASEYNFSYPILVDIKNYPHIRRMGLIFVLNQSVSSRKRLLLCHKRWQRIEYIRTEFLVGNFMKLGTDR